MLPRFQFSIHLITQALLSSLIEKRVTMAWLYIKPVREVALTNRQVTQSIATQLPVRQLNRRSDPARTLLSLQNFDRFHPSRLFRNKFPRCRLSPTYHLMPLTCPYQLQLPLDDFSNLMAELNSCFRSDIPTSTAKGPTQLVRCNHRFFWWVTVKLQP